MNMPAFLKADNYSGNQVGGLTSYINTHYNLKTKRCENEKQQDLSHIICNLSLKSKKVCQALLKMYFLKRHLTSWPHYYLRCALIINNSTVIFSYSLKCPLIYYFNSS